MKTSHVARGRHLRSTAKREKGANVAIGATLRAAAPFQLARKSECKSQRFQSSSRVKIKPDDLRFKRLKRRAGILFIFAVDASGSMALNRMAQAKGALTRLLRQAYRGRDKVAMISFRRRESELLLPATRSVELAKRLVDAMPAGGATPLAAGLVQSLSLARMSRLRGTPQTMLILFTDGRANVTLNQVDSSTSISSEDTVREELRRIGAALRKEAVATLVVDTKSRFVSDGEGSRLAELIGGQYVYLNRADAESVYDAISNVAEAVRDKRN
jgi:magnesium chelatase subunit D